MKTFGIIAIATLAAILAWNALIFFATSEGWGKSAVTNSDAPAAFVRAAAPIIEAGHGGNLSMIIIENAAIAERYNFSVGAPVDGDALFQVASLGKWITAWGVMALVEDGMLDLDAPVSSYVSRWRLPDSEFDASGVTARRLLSHTAGLTDGLGYDGFARRDDVQSLEASLDRALDAAPDKSGSVVLGAAPGAQWAYSGGGYTILQLLIEEVSNQSFAEFMAARIFAPIGMTRTTFDHDRALRLGLAQNFDMNGNVEPVRWYTALAATSLFTTANDLALFISAQVKPGGQSVLSDDALALIRTPHASQMGADIWGLGPMLYAPNNQGGHIIGHDGNNGPAINTVARFDPATGDGIVILSTGSDTLATQIAGEWVFWKTGNIDSLMFLMALETTARWMAAGSVALVILGLIAGLRARNRN